jgi:hypothetical protein
MKLKCQYTQLWQTKIKQGGSAVKNGSSPQHLVFTLFVAIPVMH